MRKLAFACLVVTLVVTIGCGNQNEYLSKGKEWVKSDKRGRIARAVAQFELAVQKEPDNAEAHYLLGYYDENATIDKRAEQMVLAYKHDKRKYLDVLIEEALRDRDENVRKSAAKALQDIHKQMDSMIKPLVKTLKSKDSRDREDAALVLSKLHNHRVVIDRVTEKDVIKHDRMETRFNAVRILGNIGDSRAIDHLMERITALKTEDEEGEEQEVRRAAVVSLRKIAKRNIDINGDSFGVQVEPVSEGVRISSGVTENTTLQKDEIITHVIDNKYITSLDVYRYLYSDALQNSEEITFGLPKIVSVTVDSLEELGIKEEELKVSNDGKGIVIGKMTVDSRARKRGIEKGETVSHINNHPVSSLEEYKRLVREKVSQAQEIRFRIANDDKYRLISVSIPEDSDDLGMRIKELDTGAVGIVVTEVEPRSPAVEAGIRKGQIITYIINRRKINSVEEYNQFIKEGLADGETTISVTNKEAVNKLIDVLRNKGLLVRFDAAQALGEIKDKAAVDSLIEMLEEEANPIEIKI
ncbi:hypothetical protein GF312_10155 [Candidatus Poribacteria bacterium]|nr:hypothetical protein [Candidatus Poribacteria bacterium]